MLYNFCMMAFQRLRGEQEDESPGEVGGDEQGEVDGPDPVVPHHPRRHEQTHHELSCHR